MTCSACEMGESESPQGADVEQRLSMPSVSSMWKTRYQSYLAMLRQTGLLDSDTHRKNALKNGLQGVFL